MNLLPYLPAAELGSCPEERRWLIEDLWADQAVGVVGGEPKCCKSFLALDMAVAVAGGSPCLRRYSVPRPGRVLLFAAEDALHVVRRRIVGICTVVGRRIEDLDLQVITAPALRLDLEADRQRLDRTVAALRPKLLVLDPFVRLHRIDENASGDVAPLLAFLRTLQRTYELAVVIVHHARKGAATLRAGQALRGSSEFHAWGDSNLYLRRTEEHIQLTIEHRAAPSPNEPVNLTLCAEGERLALQLAGAVTPAAAAVDAETLETRITQILADADRPLPIAELRGRCKVRMATLCTAMANLTEQRRVVRSATGRVILAANRPRGEGSSTAAQGRRLLPAAWGGPRQGLATIGNRDHGAIEEHDHAHLAAEQAVVRLPTGMVVIQSGPEASWPDVGFFLASGRDQVATPRFLLRGRLRPCRPAMDSGSWPVAARRPRHRLSARDRSRPGGSAVDFRLVASRDRAGQPLASTSWPVATGRVSHRLSPRCRSRLGGRPPGSMS